MAFAKLSCVLLLTGILAQAAGHVTIHSTHAGWTFQDRSVTFTCAPGFRSSKDGRCALLRQLLTTIESPPAEYTPESLGITPAWLTANVNLAIENDVPTFLPRSPDQIRLFREAFLDPIKTGELVQWFRVIRTDDYPSFVIDAYDSDGSHTVIQSKDQSICMLPWSIESQGRKYISYDRRISDAIFALLPKGFPNRERIGGADLREQFSRAVLDSIEREWDSLGRKARSR